MIDRETRDRLRAEAWQVLIDWLGGTDTPAAVLREAIAKVTALDAMEEVGHDS